MSAESECMNIKQYIDYFDEISHLQRDQQFILLEQAYNDIHANSKFPILVFIPYFIRLIMICLFLGGAYLIFGTSVWILLLSFFIGLLCSRLVIIEITDALMLKALKRNVSKNTV
jgi:hypothetical protein